MLYVSRYIGYEEYGVVDTEDGIEEVTRISQLVDIVNYGVHIEGVHSHLTSSGQYSFLDYVEPYQHPDFLTQLQVKTNLMRNVEVVVWKDMITCIKVRGRAISEPVILRLSDFGTEIGDCIFKSNACNRSHKLTLILDDKIENVTGISFCLPSVADGLSVGVDGVGVVLDVREVRSDAIIDIVYRSIFAGNSLELNASIIDQRQRKKRMMRKLCGWVR